MMAAWDVRPVSEILFLFFTGRGDSFLSPKEKEKNGGAKTYAAGSKGEAPLVERESPENRPKGSLVVSFLFLTWNRKATQHSGCLAERKKETADMELSPPRRKRNAAAFF